MTLMCEGGQKLIIYLDIDRTILYELDDDEEDYSEVLDDPFVCDGLEEFLTFALKYCEVYRLRYRARLEKSEIFKVVYYRMNLRLRFDFLVNKKPNLVEYL